MMRMTVKIDRLGAEGDGIGPGPNGQPLYAPRTLPGEDVEGVVEGDRLTDLRILAPSSDRVRPPCRHANACGGCSLQHASAEFVARWKEDVVARALAAQGLEAPFREQAISPAGSRRRATFSARRTKKGVTLGFHAAGGSQITEIPDCQVITPGLAALRPALEALARLGASRKGEVKLAVTETETGADVDVREAKALEPSVMMEAVSLSTRHRLARLTWNGEVVATHAPPTVSFDGLPVRPPPGAFLQATREGEVALRAAVDAATEGAGRIVDLFAGCGTFALPLSRRAEVHAVEGESASLIALEMAWRHVEGLKPLTIERRDLFRRPLLPPELRRFDAAVIDPPRAGAEAQMAELAEGGPERIAAISCNPITFARDITRLMRGGYRLHWVQVVDQFRWSPHVEIAAALSR